jgi:hypothetical protein
MVFFFSTRVRCLPSTPNLANLKGKVTLSRKNTQSVCRIALFYTQIWIRCDRARFYQLTAEKVPLQLGFNPEPYALRHNRPASFFAIHRFYENVASDRFCGRARWDRLLELLSPLAKLVKPFALGWTAHKAIASSTRRIEPIEFDGVAETEIADSNQALGEAVA